MATTTNTATQPITVLIEQPDFVPFASPLRRASLTPGLGLHHGSSHVHGHGHGFTQYGGPGGSPQNSIHSIASTVDVPSGSTSSSTTARLANRNSISAAGGTGGANHSAKEWNRRQRTSTTFHASIDVPDSLLAALSSIAIVNIQPSLNPLPSSRPLIVLIQLNDYIPQELSTTPSTVCFPPNTKPTKQSVLRAIHPLKTTINSLNSLEGGENVALLLYSDNAHLPPEISQAAYGDGAHGLLTPPFTPDSVRNALHAALELFESTKHLTNLTRRHRGGGGGIRRSIPPDLLDGGDLSSVSELPARRDRDRGGRERTHREPHHHKWDSLDSFTLSSSSSHNSHDASHPLQVEEEEEGAEEGPGGGAMSRSGSGLGLGLGVDDDIVDPLDTTRQRRRSAIPPFEASLYPIAAVDDIEIGFTYGRNGSLSGDGKGNGMGVGLDRTVPFPLPDYPFVRRASVDVGALGLALPKTVSSSPAARFYQTSYPLASPISSNANSTSQAYSRGNSHSTSPSTHVNSRGNSNSNSNSHSAPTSASPSSSLYSYTNTNTNTNGNWNSPFEGHNNNNHTQHLPSPSHAKQPSISKDASGGWGWAGFDVDGTAIQASIFGGGGGSYGNGPGPDGSYGAGGGGPGGSLAGLGAGPWGRRGTVVPGRATADVRNVMGKGGGGVNPGGMFDVEEEGDGLGVAELLIAMHLHGTAALENASALTAGSPTTSTTGTGAFSPSTTTPTTTRFPASVSTTNLAGINTGGAIHQRRQSSPTDSTVPNAFSPPPPPVPALPFPSILTATPRTLSRLRAQLSSWHFEPYLLSPPETLLCVQLVFEALLGGLKLSSSTSASASNPAEGQDPSTLDSPPITMADHLVPFLTDLMRLYRRENRYHSFVHALDVLQAVYTFLELQGRVDSVAVAFLDGDGSSERELEYGNRRGYSHANAYAYAHGSGHEGGDRGRGRGRVSEVSEDEPSPLSLLSDDDLFLLCLAAIGHDVGHPGNSNAFLKNAEAPLSKLYEHKSALERMHCTLLLRLLRKHGMGHLISLQTPRGRDGRWLIVGTILATDMSWHFEWVERFGRAMKDRRAMHKKNQGRSIGGSPDLVVNSSGSGAWIVVEQDQVAAPSGTDDPDAPGRLSQEEVDREDRLFMCQAMMKCADISNPCRPHNISRHWSTVLLEEWAAQALLERHLGLPVSVVADANEKVQCVGQVSFIKLFTQPLFDIVAGALPGLSVIAKQCTENRILWESKLANFEEIAAAQATIPPRLSTSSSSSKSTQQMIRPIPLALPILPSMARYAKTVFPLSLPSLRTKKQLPAARALASMSPWHSVTQGKKISTAMTASTTTGTSHSNNSGTSGRTSGSGRVWSHSRPESFSSSSTLSSVGAGGGAGGSGLSPTTPTSTGMPSTSVYGRSPVSPLMSPFATSAVVSKSTASGTSGGAASRPLPPSVWDVDPLFAEELRKEVRLAWARRDGRSRKRGRRRFLEEDFHIGDLGDGEIEAFPGRRWSLDP